MANTELLFEMQTQQESNWCWAANAASISAFYSSSSNWTQCSIACEIKEKQTCCQKPVPDYCDKPDRLDDALDLTRNLRTREDNSLNFEAIKNEIDRGRLIGVRIGWSDGGGHFITIFGYDDQSGNSLVHVADCSEDDKVDFLSLDELTNNYESDGEWTHSYFTDPLDYNMFTFKKVDTKLWEATKKILPDYLFKSRETLKLWSVSAAEAGVPHDVYILGYKSLLANTIPEIKKKGFRYTNLTDDKSKKLIFEFSDNFSKEKSQNIIHGEKYTNRYFTVLSNVIRVYSRREENFELRLLKQPQLNVAAFWAHSLDNSSDEFISINDNGGLVSGKTYSYDDFFRILSESAGKKGLSTDNLAGG